MTTTPHQSEWEKLLKEQHMLNVGANCEWDFDGQCQHMHAIEEALTQTEADTRRAVIEDAVQVATKAALEYSQSAGLCMECTTDVVIINALKDKLKS